MPKTRLDLLTNIKGHCGLLSDSGYDTTLGSWLNDAKDEWQSRYLWDYLRTTVNITTTATDLYDLGVEALIYNATNYSANYKLTYVTENELDGFDAQQVQSGNPTHYTQSGYYKATDGVALTTAIRFYPIPTAGLTLKVRVYSRIPSLTASSDVYAIPETYQSFLVHYVCFMYFQAVNDNRAASHYDLKENVLKMAVDQLGATPADQINVLRSPDDISSNEYGLRLPSNYPL